MKIFVNDSPHQAPKEIKLKSFLHSINLDDFRGWAVALNEAVIPEDEMENVTLQEGDKLILIQATQGG